MKRLWWSQVQAVMRLELKKTFFARRGLWIYVIAALPVLLFVAYAIATSTQDHRRASVAGKTERPLSYQDLLAVKPGMTSKEVIAVLGRPPSRFHWTDSRPAERQDDSEKEATIETQRDEYRYSDGQNDLYVGLENDRVESIHIQKGSNLGQDSTMFAGVFQFFFLRLAVFFGCVGIFMNLFRGEILDRSLHFYFLAPIRREVLMAGKFLAGLLATCTIFVISEILQTVAFLWHFPPAMRDVYLYHNHGMEYAAIYAGVTILACIGYGSFFLVAGMLFKNPILPTAAILVWEGINPFLPGMLKQFSVIYYLKSLCPVDIQIAPGTSPVLALLVSNTDPVSPPLAIAGLLIVVLIALGASSLQVRRMEINYTTE